MGCITDFVGHIDITPHLNEGDRLPGSVPTRATSIEEPADDLRGCA